MTELSRSALAFAVRQLVGGMHKRGRGSTSGAAASFSSGPALLRVVGRADMGAIAAAYGAGGTKGGAAETDGPLPEGLVLEPSMREVRATWFRSSHMIICIFHTP